MRHRVRQERSGHGSTADEDTEMSDTKRAAFPLEALPQEVRETLDAADGLYAALTVHAPVVLFPHEVEQQWKRLGECLAWLRR